MPVKSLNFILVVVSLMLSAEAVLASTVTLPGENGITLEANYLSGETGKPALIFIHGFLQTRNFSTVERLYSSLNESGYSVLAPTLSLGISNRAEALPCESIHLHSLAGDSEEIHQWISWAKKQGHKEIVLIGHSAGSVNLSHYLLEHQSPEVKKAILISLTYFGEGRPAAYETGAQATKARALLAAGNNELTDFSLAYCKKYVTTPKNFLSYYDWSDKKVLESITNKAVKSYVVIGAADNRIGQDWVSQLQKNSQQFFSIEGASHFFDDSHEFDLLDVVEEILEEK